MKHARVARKHWDCDKCSDPILPGQLYLEDSRRDRYIPTKFHTERFCAPCINNAIKPAPIGPPEEADEFWRYINRRGITAEDARAEVLFARWKEAGCPTE